MFCGKQDAVEQTFEGGAQMKKVAVVGSFVVDLMARTPHLPEPGETVMGSFFKAGPGGKAANQTAAAKKAARRMIS